MQACTGEELFKDESTENSSLLKDEKAISQRLSSEFDPEIKVISEKNQSKIFLLKIFE